MTSAVLTLKRWGDGLGVRLPAAVVRTADLHAAQRISITSEGGSIFISPLGNNYPTAGTAFGAILTKAPMTRI